MRREAIQRLRSPLTSSSCGALGLVNVVLTVPPSCAIRSFAEGAKLAIRLQFEIFLQRLDCPRRGFDFTGRVGRGLGCEINTVLILGVGIFWIRRLWPS